MHRIVIVGIKLLRIRGRWKTMRGPLDPPVGGHGGAGAPAAREGGAGRRAAEGQ